MLLRRDDWFDACLPAPHGDGSALRVDQRELIGQRGALSPRSESPGISCPGGVEQGADQEADRGGASPIATIFRRSSASPRPGSPPSKRGQAIRSCCPRARFAGDQGCGECPHAHLTYVMTYIPTWVSIITNIAGESDGRKIPARVYLLSLVTHVPVHRVRQPTEHVRSHGYAASHIPLQV